MSHILWFRVMHARNYLLRRWHKEIGRDHNNSSSSHLAVELIMVQGRQFCCTRSMKSCLLLRNMQIFQSTLDSLQARLHPFLSSLGYLVQMCFWRNLIPGTTMSKSGMSGPFPQVQNRKGLAVSLFENPLPEVHRQARNQLNTILVVTNEQIDLGSLQSFHNLWTR